VAGRNAIRIKLDARDNADAESYRKDIPIPPPVRPLRINRTLSHNQDNENEAERFRSDAVREGVESALLPKLGQREAHPK